MRYAAALAAILAAVGCGSHVKRAATAAREGRAALVVERPDRNGRWTRLILSPNAKTYLGQWSGECELRTAYFVPAAGGKPRPITDYARGSAQSVAAGWAGRRARVWLPQGQSPSRRPGVYLVDPATMDMVLERALPRSAGC